MQGTVHVTPRVTTSSGGRLWTARIITGLVVLFLLFDAVIHIAKIAPVVTAFAQLGYPLSTAVGLGVVEIICIVLYVVPATSVLGAILLTGYLGGATATQLRVGAPIFPLLFPAILGVLLWGALVLRDERLRGLLPVTSSRSP